MAELNLDALQPDRHVITFRGIQYELPGAVPVPTIIEAAKLDQGLTDAQDGDDAGEVAAAAEKMYDLVMELLRDCDPEVQDLRLTIEDMTMILGLVTSGSGEGLEFSEALMDVLAGQDEASDGDPDEEGKEGAEGVPPTESQAEKTAAPRGARPKRSRARSSG